MTWVKTLWAWWVTGVWARLSRVWQRRIRGSAIITVATVLSLLLGCAAISGADTAWHLVYPRTPPPIPDVARDTSAPARAFAEHCVPAVLEATNTTAAKNLGDCNPPDHAYVFEKTAMPTTTTAIGATTRTQKFEGTLGDADLWAVKVQVWVRTYPSATPDLEYYSIPVAVAKDGGCTAADKITRLGQPPAGPKIGPEYSDEVKADSELHGVLSGFIIALLSGGPDLSRYITTDSGINAISGYSPSSINMTGAATGDTGDNPANGSEVGARIEVTATRTDRARTDQLAYPLTLRIVDGRWFVAGIDAIPAVASTDQQPSNTEKEEGNKS